MALSVDSPIIDSDIVHIQMFKALKVFQLEGQNDEKLVIKVDAIQPHQYKSSNVAIKAVAPGAKHKILTAGEVGALRSFIALFEKLTADYAKFGLTYHFSEAAAVADLKQAIGIGGPVIKMRAVDVKELKGAVADRMAGKKDDLQAFTESLVTTGGLERLGQIVAVDLFNGNTDRFNPAFKEYQSDNRNKAAKKSHTIGNVTITARVLVNVGNVFTMNTANGPGVGALDFVDPNSVFKDINHPLASSEASMDMKWPGRVLENKAQRKEFAKDIVHDLEKFLSPKKSALSLKTKLGRNADDRVNLGMVQGAAMIKQKLEAKYNPNKWTVGAKERYVVMCAVK